MPSAELRLPQRRERPPHIQIARRVGFAVLVLVVSSVIVWLDRDGYRDSTGAPISFLSAVYYSTVSLSTTGYGDIVPVTTSARLLTIFIITPLRFLFLIVLVGTTISALSERSRQQYQVSRWRARVRNHTIICGFGTKGQAAAKTIIADGVPPERVVVIDPRPEALGVAQALGVIAVQGDAEKSHTLRKAEVERARAVLITVHDDNSAVMITLTVRQLTTAVYIAACVREEENVALLEQSGARSVITAQEAAGRLVGIAARRPPVAAVVEDLISYGSGLDLRQRQVTEVEIGRTAGELDDVVIVVVRGTREEPVPANLAGELRRGDQLVYVRFPDQAAR